MNEKRLYQLMDKYGKLKGTIDKPFFSDRQFAMEILYGVSQPSICLR